MKLLLFVVSSAGTSLNLISFSFLQFVLNFLSNNQYNKAGVCLTINYRYAEFIANLVGDAVLNMLT